jgi:hypothetical protein
MGVLQRLRFLKEVAETFLGLQREHRQQFAETAIHHDSMPDRLFAGIEGVKRSVLVTCDEDCS